MTVPLRPQSMDPDELRVHWANADKMFAAGRTPAEIAQYMDSVGVPRTKPIADPMGFSPLPTNNPAGSSNPDMPSTLKGLTMAVGQGITFGFGDEAVGALMGLITDQSVDEATQHYRDVYTAFKQQHPSMAMAGEIAGAAGTGILAGPAGMALRGAAPSLLRAAGAGLIEGGIAGGLSGAGNTEGSISERLANAGKGAVVGSVLGGAGAVAAKGIGSVVKPLGAKIPKIGAKMFGSADEQADDLVRQALERDGLSLDDAIDAARRAPAGAPVTIGEVGGENVRGLAQAAAGIPGRAKETLKTELLGRQEDQGARLLVEAVEKSKLGIQNVYAMTEQLIAKRSAGAEPLYEMAFKGTDGALRTIPIDDELKSLLRHPVLKQAYEVGRAISRTDPDAVDLPAMMVTKGAGGIAGLFAKGTQDVADELPVRGLDYMKRGLDKITSPVIRGTGEPVGLPEGFSIDRASAYALRKRLGKVLEKVDDLIPEYKAARMWWRGETEAAEALDLGRAFMSKPPDLVAEELKGMTGGMKEMYRIGALESIKNKVYGARGDAPDVAKTIFGSGKEARNATLRLQHLFGDPAAAEEFKRAVMTEAKISQTTRLLAGSRTTPMERGIRDLEGSAGDIVAAGTRGIGATLIAAGSAARGRARAGWTEQVSDALATKFTRGLNDRRELVAYLQSLKMRPSGPGRAGTSLSAVLGLGAGKP